MTSMIPWIESHVISIGPIQLQTWGTFVAVGFLVGTWIAARRARGRVDPKYIWDMAFWIFIAALVGSRLFHVIFYDPVYYFAHPWDAIDPTKPGFAIIGGLLASAAVFLLFVRRRRLDFLAYADVLIWGVPWGCGIGRIGCFFIHDHPGTLSSFVLAVKYPDGYTRHDLGLYLSLVGFAIGLIFLALNRKQRVPGFFLGAFLILDGLSRLWLDFYRVGDIRYADLTPTQWLSMPLVAVGVWLVTGRMIRRAAMTCAPHPTSD